MARELEPYQNIERSIIKKFRKEIWRPFIEAVQRYELVNEGDKIAVCISGGKDSMLMAKLMQELQRHSKVKFELVFLVMDPGYNEINRQKIESNAELLHIPITVFETDVFAVANTSEKNPCYLCARMRRGYLYSKAQELGCNKIALGHRDARDVDVLRRTAAGDASEAAQQKLRGHGADPSDVLHSRGRDSGLETLQQPAVYPVCVPVYGKLRDLR